MCMCAQMLINTCINTHICIRRCIKMQQSTYKCNHNHASAHIHYRTMMLEHKHVYNCTYTVMNMCSTSHWYVCIQLSMHACAHEWRCNSWLYAYRLNMHTHVCVYMCSGSCVCTNPCVYANIHTHTAHGNAMGMKWCSKFEPTIL